MKIYSNLSFIIIVVAFLTAIIAYKEKKGRAYGSLLMLMTFLAFSITLRKLSSAIGINAELKMVIFNLFLLVEIGFYYLIYFFLLNRVQFKKQAKNLGFIYLIIGIIITVFIQPLNSGYTNYAYSVGAFGVLYLILLFFYEQLNNGGYATIFKNFWFWLSAGLFVFLSSEIPIMNLLNYLLETNTPVNKCLPVFKLKIVLSTLYYLIFTLAYYLCRMNK